MCYQVLTYIGLILIFKSFCLLLYYVQFFIRFLKNVVWPPNYITKYGKWAVITGCTDGIGLAYTHELAKRGFRLVLISRSEEKLKTVAADLVSKYNSETKIIAADFSHGLQVYEKIGSVIRNLDIGVLVNNVGCGTSGPSLIESTSEQMVWDFVTVNVLAATLMIKLVLPEMKIRRRGAIVNISSIGGLIPCPYTAIYSATKFYIDALTRAVDFECRNSGVTIQLLYPGYVKTKMIPDASKISKILMPSPESYAKQAFWTLGASDVNAGYIIHELQATWAQDAPLWLTNYNFDVGYRQHEGKN